MSKTSIIARNKAIRLAWEREQKLVAEGKGTREWSQIQQKDILDPEKGKAYDENGRAFEGQHMKSAAEYPEHQGNPDNIQFLTREEHLEAHKGSWQNPTNWYYDPITKEFTDFGDGDFIPCKVIKLSDPVCPSERITLEIEKNGAVENQSDEIAKRKSVAIESVKNSSDTPALPQTPPSVTTLKPKSFRGKVVQFFGDHPKLTQGLKIAGIIGGILSIGYVADKLISGNSSESSDSSDSVNDYLPRNPYDDYEDSNYDDTSDISDEKDYPDERSSPKEHTVPSHGQHYHTKDGVIWKEKEAYQRGGKHKDDE